MFHVKQNGGVEKETTAFERNITVNTRNIREACLFYKLLDIIYFVVSFVIFLLRLIVIVCFILNVSRETFWVYYAFFSILNTSKLRKQP